MRAANPRRRDRRRRVVRDKAGPLQENVAPSIPSAPPNRCSLPRGLTNRSPWLLLRRAVYENARAHPLSDRLPTPFSQASIPPRLSDLFARSRIVPCMPVALRRRFVPGVIGERGAMVMSELPGEFVRHVADGLCGS